MAPGAGQGSGHVAAASSSPWGSFTFGLLALLLIWHEQVTQAAAKGLAGCPTAPATDAQSVGEHAYKLQQAGRFEEALGCFKSSSDLLPSNPVPREFAGHCYLALGDPESAVRELEDAIELDHPNPTNAYFSLGRAKNLLGDFIGSERAYERVVTYQPGNAGAHVNRAVAQRNLGDLGAAAISLRAALSIKHDFPEAHVNLGTVEAARGNYESAVIAYEQCIKLKPDLVAAYGNLATAYGAMGDKERELASWTRAAKVAPEYGEARYQVGRAAYARGDLKVAARELKAASKHSPRDAAVANDYGNLLRDQRRPERALEQYEKAAALKKDFPEALSNLAGTLVDVDASPAARVRARDLYRSALSLKPDLLAAHKNLGNLLQEDGDLEGALVSVEAALSLSPGFAPAVYSRAHLKAQLCDWSTRDADRSSLISALRLDLAGGTGGGGGETALQPLHAMLAGLPADLSLALARSYAGKAARVAASHGVRPTTAHNGAKPGARLRVGFLSADVRAHPVAHLMVGAYRAFDRARFEVVVYAANADDGSEARRNVAAACDRLVDVSGLGDAELAARVSGDGVHVLVELNGFTQGDRLAALALRPAPVQLSFLGYSGTLGADFIDYVVVDRVVAPAPSRAAAFHENLLVLPAPFLANSYAEALPGVPSHPPPRPREEVGLPRQAFVFCSFNHLYKSDPGVFSAWAGALARAPGSVLWLSRSRTSAGNAAAAEPRLREEARAAGVDPARLIFAGTFPEGEHVAQKMVCDLFLDTPTYNAHTTGADVMWAGVPLLTLPLDRMVSRAGASLMVAAGCPGGIVGTLRAYEDAAVRLATDPEAFRELRACVEGGRPGSLSPAGGGAGGVAALWDTGGWVRGFETGLQTVWEIYVAGGGSRRRGDVMVAGL